MSRTYRTYLKTKDDSVSFSKFKRLQRRRRRAKEKDALRHHKDLPVLVKYDRWGER